MGTSQNLAMQHAGKIEVRAKIGSARHLVDSVRTYRPSANRLVIQCFCHFFLLVKLAPALLQHLVLRE